LYEEGLLSSDLTYLKGVGPRKAEVLAAHGIESVRDLLEYYPRRYLDRTSVTPIADLHADIGEITVVGRVVKAEVKGFARRQRFEVLLSDGSHTIGLVWFRRLHWIKKFFVIGEVIAASAKPTDYRGWQMQHPAVEKLNLDLEDAEEGPLLADASSDEILLTPMDENFHYKGQVVAIYPGTEELRKAWLDSRAISRIIRSLYYRREIFFDDVLPEAVRKRHHLVDLTTAVHNVHLASSLEAVQKARRCLKFQELFLLELMLAWRKAHIQSLETGISFPSKEGKYLKALHALLPFELTGAQQRSLDEIFSDMRLSAPMNRLLQGDVGSGKTLVALCAMLLAVEGGHQAALMAPTEILAEQHFRNFLQFTDALGLRVTLLTGSRKGEDRRRALEEIAGGWSHLVIGTHALFQEGVEFARLGLAVIDEQHRFGVEQRAALKRKAPVLDTLVMTATPIPRTLAIVQYGDMDLSIIDELPPGRKPITTVWRRETKRRAIFEFVRDEVEKGAQAYIVYPLVEESAKLDLRAAEEAKVELETSWLKGLSIGLLHGRMKGPEKDQVMQAFLRGDLQVLVSTTVIEVGVDNPNATIMVVEQAERFGLSQLHQLRGRVGRGSAKSYCVLIAGKAMSAEGKLRLETMATTSSGFDIAEVDLNMRGTGDFFGTRQSGLPQLKIADIMKDVDLLVQAREAAFALMRKDPGLMGHPYLRRHLVEAHGERMERMDD
jgi:ATP-dependent DNA helicase RecG